MSLVQVENIFFFWVLPAVVIAYAFVVWRWSVAWDRYWESKWAMEDRAAARKKASLRDRRP